MLKTPNEIIKMNLGYEPAAFAGGPVVIQTELSTFVMFKAVLSERAADGKHQIAGFALVEFIHCQVAKFGLPNNDAWAGHPLYSRIIEADGWMSILEVRNSSWKAELKRQNKVSYTDWDWPHKHYIISFRESTFECVAKDIQIRVLDEPAEPVLQQITLRVLTDLSKS
jgi:hypothetical protein